MAPINPDIIPVYAAGLFDGEGCVRVSATTGKLKVTSCRLTISNNDTRPLEMLKEIYGGSLEYRTDKHCAAWTVSGYLAEWFAQDILPYSIVKKEQLELFLEFRSTILERGGGERITAQILNRRNRLAAKISKLKRVA